METKKKVGRPQVIRPQDKVVMRRIVDELCGGSVSRLALALDVPRPSISRVLGGTFGLMRYRERIEMAFPGISGEFLDTGEGYMGDVSPKHVAARMQKTIDDRDATIAMLRGEVERQGRVIDLLMKQAENR